MSFNSLTLSLHLYHGSHLTGDSGCDVPLKYFFLLLGISFALHAVLLCMQLSYPLTNKRLRRIVAASSVPALMELVMLILGTVWAYRADRCHIALKTYSWSFVIVLWCIVAFGVVAKLYFKCSKPTGPKWN